MHGSGCRKTETLPTGLIMAIPYLFSTQCVLHLVTSHNDVIRPTCTLHVLYVHADGIDGLGNRRMCASTLTAVYPLVEDYLRT